MNKGLGFINRSREIAAAAKPADKTTGKYVLKDLTKTAELFELLSVSAMGMQGEMVIRLRSTYNGAIYVLSNFWQVRPAFPNEAQANARQGSEQFDQYWAANSHQYY